MENQQIGNKGRNPEMLIQGVHLNKLILGIINEYLNELSIDNLLVMPQ